MRAILAARAARIPAMHKTSAILAARARIPAMHKTTFQRHFATRISRSRRERRDSVTEAIVEEREAWLARLEALETSSPRDRRWLRDIKALGLGRRRAGAAGAFRRREPALDAVKVAAQHDDCLLYTSPSPRD